MLFAEHVGGGEQTSARGVTLGVFKTLPVITAIAVTPALGALDVVVAVQAETCCDGGIGSPIS